MELQQGMGGSTKTRRSLRSFIRWMKYWGIEISDGLEIVEGESKGIACGELGVKATYDFQEGDAIALIPKDACLTLRTTGAAHALDDAQLAGGLGLVAALMYERSRAETSPWFPYLNQLPLYHEALPIVWEPEEIDTLLLGTELHPVVMEDRRLMEEDWKECIWPLTQVYPNEFPEEQFTLQHYFFAKTLVASRSFEVDEFHGYGMVPLADLFNHKTCGEDVHIMREAELDPLERMMNSGKASAVEERDCSGFLKLEETIMSERDNHSRSDVLEIVLIRNVSGGSEIFNTYGQLSNASLLHRHGFTEPDNPYDIVNIDFTLVMQYCTSFFSERYVRNRVRLWRKYGCCALKSQATEYFEIEACGKPQSELLFFLYILHLSEKAVLAAEIFLHELKVGGDDNCNFQWEVKVLKTICKEASGRPRWDPCSFLECERSIGDLDRVLLTAEVCEALLWLSAGRDKAYGKTSLEEDLKLHTVVRPKEDSKLFYALSLRISERSILKRLQYFCYERLEKLSGR